MKRWIVIVGTLAVAVIATFHFTGRTHTRKVVSDVEAPTSAEQPTAVAARTPLPPVGEPLVASAPSLFALASIGDRMAADRLWRDTALCKETRRLDEFFRGGYAQWLVNQKLMLEQMDEARRNQVIAQVKTELALVDSTREMCAGADSNINGVRFYEVALVAARTGNDDALTCLLEAPRVREMTSAKAAQIDQEAMALGQHLYSVGAGMPCAH